MKRFLTPAILFLGLALCLVSPAALAKTKKAAPDKAAVQKCNDDYKAALKEAKTKKGNEHKEAVAAAKKSHKECLTSAQK